MADERHEIDWQDIIQQLHARHAAEREEWESTLRSVVREDTVFIALLFAIAVVGWARPGLFYGGSGSARFLLLGATAILLCLRLTDMVMWWREDRRKEKARWERLMREATEEAAQSTGELLDE